MNDDAQHALSLLAEHGRRLHALLFRITLREDAAEDLMQELFMRLSRPRTLSRAADPTGYAVRTAMRLAFDWRRSQCRRRDAVTIAAEPASTDAQPSRQLDDREDLQAVLNALEQLPTLLRDVVVMRYLQSQPYEIIAAAIGKSTHHARAICHKGIVRLRRMTAPNEIRITRGTGHEH